MIAPPELQKRSKTGLARELGLLGLAATGICSMMGAAINIIPFMLQRNVPGIGANVLPAYLFAALPALFAAIAYAILASAMPRAGGSYIYASRSLNPYLGFVASFSQWFGLSIAIGVVSYVTVPFLRDVFIALSWTEAAAFLEIGSVRLTLALLFLWTFVIINLRGLGIYKKTLVPMMFLMFLLGGVVIVAGFSFDQAEFIAAVQARDGVTIPEAPASPFDLTTFLAASAVLFASFIGFDSIAQAGGEAKRPERNLPIAIGLAVLIVGSFYLLFTAAMYHVVPWNYIAAEAATRDLTAPGLLGYLLSPGWTVAILGGAVVALINDLPAMLLAVSRLMFAWAKDGIFPKAAARVSPKFNTPQVAILLSGLMATLGILGSHLAGDFFLGVDILVTSMLVNFLLMCVSVLALHKRNPEIASRISVFSSRPLQWVLGGLGTVLLTGFLVIHIAKDMRASLDAWYFHSTPIWLIVMGIATAIYLTHMRKLKREGVDVETRFNTLPAE